MKPNYNSEKRRKELDRKKKKEEKELKKKLRREAIARGEIPEGEDALISEYLDVPDGGDEEDDPKAEDES